MTACDSYINYSYLSLILSLVYVAFLRLLSFADQLYLVKGAVSDEMDHVEVTSALLNELPVSYSESAGGDASVSEESVDARNRGGLSFFLNTFLRQK